MHPSRAPSSHPSSAAWLPCPTSAASTTATSDERRRPGRSLFPPAAKSKCNIHSRRFCRRQCYQRPLTVSSLHPPHDGHGQARSQARSLWTQAPRSSFGKRQLPTLTGCVFVPAGPGAIGASHKRRCGSMPLHRSAPARRRKCRCHQRGFTRSGLRIGCSRTYSMAVPTSMPRRRTVASCSWTLSL